MGVGGLHELLLDEEKLEVDEEMHYVTMLYDAAGEWRVGGGGCGLVYF